jgi:hypothetical protein
MIRETSIACCALFAATGCGQNDRHASSTVDCSVQAAYEVKTIDEFLGGLSNWFIYADATPGASPVLPNPPNPPASPAPRCGDTAMAEIKVFGHNFYGGGFGNWALFDNRADGTGYEGIAFWARSPGNVDKTFTLYVDDGRTAVSSVGGLAGDVAPGTRCRRPPEDSLGRVACYGGTLPPATPTRVPEADECGNRFHATVTTTENWQYFLLPWEQLVQFPCPNRLVGGIDPADIAGLEIKFLQGATYDLWLDNFEFYKRRADAGL